MEQQQVEEVVRVAPPPRASTLADLHQKHGDVIASFIGAYPGGARAARARPEYSSAPAKPATANGTRVRAARDAARGGGGSDDDARGGGGAAGGCSGAKPKKNSGHENLHHHHHRRAAAAAAAAAAARSHRPVGGPMRGDHAENDHGEEGEEGWSSHHRRRSMAADKRSAEADKRSADKRSASEEERSARHPEAVALSLSGDLSATRRFVDTFADDLATFVSPSRWAVVKLTEAGDMCCFYMPAQWMMARLQRAAGEKMCRLSLHGGRAADRRERAAAALPRRDRDERAPRRGGE